MTVKSWKHCNYPANPQLHLTFTIMISVSLSLSRMTFFVLMPIFKTIKVSQRSVTLFKQQWSRLGTLLLYLFILRAHLGHQHGDVVRVPHPGVTGEVLQNHHGFVKASDRLHHPKVNKRRRQNHSEKKGWNGGRWEAWGEKTQGKNKPAKEKRQAARRSGGIKTKVREEMKGRCFYKGDFKR